MTDLLIADDQALVRVGLRKILDNEPDINVIGEAGDGQDAVATARQLQPDLILMDIRMPILDGIEATRRIVGDHPPHHARAGVRTYSRPVSPAIRRLTRPRRR